MIVEKLIKKNKPFAVLHYYEWMKSQPDERCSVYEVLIPYTNQLGLKHYYTKVLTKRHDIVFFLNNKDKFDLKEETKDGKAYEFNNFREYLKS